MILVTRINKVEQFYINEDMIEFIEETPDTIISLVSGKRVVVMESAELVIARIRQSRQRQAAWKDEPTVQTREALDLPLEE